MGVPAAVADLERAQFVRDLHDQITHALGQIHMHVGALQAVGVARGQSSLDAIRVACASALHDLRRMHGVIGDARAVSYRPQPTLASLRELIDATRTADTTVAIALEDGVVPPSTASGAHRIIREVLDQLRSAHGLTLAGVDVRVAGGELRLTVDVRTRASVDPADPADPASGIDLSRAQVRAVMLGGTLQRLGDGTRSTVVACLPLGTPA